MAKISVTVPIYNTGKYLRKCLDSLSEQTLDGIEFILVDDGSTDGSDKICDEYASKDVRYKVIHKENGGLASARQAGLDAAGGEYVIVCDSDDWVEPDMYETLYNEAAKTGADIVLCGHFAEFPDGRTVEILPSFTTLETDGFKHEVLRNGQHTSWNKLVKRDLFNRANAAYKPGINLGEDSFILMQLLQASPRIAMLPKAFYHYRRLPGEATYTNSVRMEHINQLFYIYNWLKTNYDNREYSNEIALKAYNIVFTCLRVKNLDTKFFSEFISNEIKINKALSIGNTPKGIMVVLAKYLPLSWSRSIFKSLYKYFYK